MSDPGREMYLLPPGYDPDSDGARLVVEQFLDWENPPTRIRCEPVDEDRWAVVVLEGGTK